MTVPPSLRDMSCPRSTTPSSSSLWSTTPPSSCMRSTTPCSNCTWSTPPASSYSWSATPSSRTWRGHRGRRRQRRRIAQDSEYSMAGITPPLAATQSAASSQATWEPIYIVPSREINHFTSYHGFISSMSCITILCRRKKTLNLAIFNANIPISMQITFYT